MLPSAALAAILARLAAILAQLAAVLARLAGVLAHLLPRQLDQIHDEDALPVQVREGVAALESDQRSGDAQPILLGASLRAEILAVIAPVTPIVSEIVPIIGARPRAVLRPVFSELPTVRAELPIVPPELRPVARQLGLPLGQLGPEQVAQPGVHRRQRARVHRGARLIELREHRLQRGRVTPVVPALAGILSQLAPILGTLGAVARGLAMSGRSGGEQGDKEGRDKGSSHGVPLGRSVRTLPTRNPAVSCGAR